MDAPLHLVLANNLYPPHMAGGAELIVAYLAEGLAARGHRVTVVSTCGPEMEPYPTESQNGVEILRFFPRNLYWSFTRVGQPGYKKMLWHLRDAWNRDAGKRLRAILEERRPDLLHTHVIDGMSASLWRAAQRRRIPVVHTAHDYHLLCPRALLLTRDLKLCTTPSAACRLYRRWHLRTTNAVSLFCSPSQFLLDTHRTAGLTLPRARVVHNGVPLPAERNGDTRTPGAPHFLFIARLTREKGCEVVLDALSGMPPDLPFTLEIAGKGPYEAAFRAVAEVDARVRFLGYVSDEAKAAAFHRADCLLLPSLWYENAPVVIVEAAAYGLGVIASRLGALPEFVGHETTGLLFEPGSGTDLAAAMQRVMNEPELKTRFKTLSAPFAEHSRAEAMVERYLSVYRTLLEG